MHDILEPTGGNACLVLEYIPGETLAERMARGPLGLNEAFSIALQIAEAVPVSMATLEETGPRVPIIEKVLSDSVYGSAQFAFSNEGTLVYVPGGDTGVSTPIWVDRQEKAQPQELRMPAQIYGTPNFHPTDNSWQSVLVNFDPAYMSMISLRGAKQVNPGRRRGRVHLGTGRQQDRVLLCHRGRERMESSLAQADGSGKPELLYSGLSGLSPRSWYPDGKRLMIGSSDRNLSVLSVDEPRVLEPVFTADLEVLSPDGEHIAYASNKEGDFNVYVSTYPKFDRTTRISPEFGEEPVWSHNACFGPGAGFVKTTIPTQSP